MKKLLICMLMAVILAGCGSEIPKEQKNASAKQEENKSADSEDIFNACVHSGEFDKLVDFDSDYMLIYFGIDTKNLVNFAAGEALDATSADTLIVLKVQEGKMKDVKEKIDTYFERKLEELENYNAEEYAKAKKCKVVENGDYLYLAICEEPDKVEDIIEGMI